MPAMSVNRCSRCDSESVIPDGVLSTRQGTWPGPVDVGFDEDPQALLLKGPVRVPLRVQICGECGHVDLYAESSRRLFEAYLRATDPKKLDELKDRERCLRCGVDLRGGTSCPGCGWTWNT